MHTTFFRLFTASRSLGSNLWLPIAIFSSAVLALLISLPICARAGVPLDPVVLSEALPFIVCTVGFDKPLRLARAVLSHPDASRPPSSGAATPILGGTRRQHPKQAGTVVLDALDTVGSAVLRDYALEIAYSRVGGLRDLCAFTAILLTIDCVVTLTFYLSVLAVMVEVRFSALPFISVPSDLRSVPAPLTLVADPGPYHSIVQPFNSLDDSMNLITHYLSFYLSPRSDGSVPFVRCPTASHARLARRRRVIRTTAMPRSVTGCRRRCSVPRAVGSMCRGIASRLRTRFRD
jgi:hypothetical protein